MRDNTEISIRLVQTLTNCICTFPLGVHLCLMQVFLVIYRVGREEGTGGGGERLIAIRVNKGFTTLKRVKCLDLQGKEKRIP